MSEIIYVNGSNITDKDDENAVAYIRVDCTDSIQIKNKIDLYAVGDDYYDDDYYEPCCDCAHNDTAVVGYPCAACVHA